MKTKILLIAICSLLISGQTAFADKQPVSMEFREFPAIDVLRTIAKVTEANYVNSNKYGLDKDLITVNINTKPAFQLVEVLSHVLRMTI